MKSDGVLIGSIVFLALGLGLIFGYCHGTVGFNAAYPASGASLQLNVVTTGMPAMAGFAFTVLGLVLLVVAFFQAVVRLTPPPRAAVHREGSGN